MHKLTGSMKELFRSGEGERKSTCFHIDIALDVAYGNSMRTCAEDLIKFGTTMSTSEPILGEHTHTHQHTYTH